MLLEGSYAQLPAAGQRQNWRLPVLLSLCALVAVGIQRYANVDKALAVGVGLGAAASIILVALERFDLAVGLFIVFQPILGLMRHVHYLYLGWCILSVPFFLSLVMFAVAAVRSGEEGQRRPVTAEDMLFVGFAALAVLPVAWAERRDLAALQYQLAILEPLLFYLAVGQACKAPAGRETVSRFVSWAFLAVGVVVLAEVALRGGTVRALVGFLWGGARHFGAAGNNVTGGLGEPLGLGQISVMFWPLVAGRYLRTSRLVPDGIATLLMPVYVLLSVSRAPILVLGLAFPCLVLLLWRVPIAGALRRLVSVSALVVLLCLLLVGRQIAHRFDVFDGDGTPARTISFGGRDIQAEMNAVYRIWGFLAAVDGWIAHPWGVGGFNAPLGVRLPGFSPKGDIPVPLFIAEAFYHGWPAALAFALFVGCLSVRAWRCYWVTRDVTSAGVLLALIAAILVLSLNGTGRASAGDISAGIMPRNNIGIWWAVLCALAESCSGLPHIDTSASTGSQRK